MLAQQPQIVTRLRDFVLSDGQWLLGHTREYQLNDAVSELGRLLKLGGAVADTVRPALQHILSTYSYGGTGSQGDPGLKPLESKNIDLSIEKYFGKRSYISLAAFRKNLIRAMNLQMTAERERRAGAFNLVNAVAGAYAERVPLVVLSGAPAAHEAASGLLLHVAVRSSLGIVLFAFADPLAILNKTRMS